MCIVITRQKKTKSGAIFGKTKKITQRVPDSGTHIAVSKKIKVVNC